MSSVLFLFVGGSIDYARYSVVRTDVMESLDAASLAIARMEEVHGDWTTVELVEYGERFFVENAKNERALLKPDHTNYAMVNEIVKFDLMTDEAKVNVCVDATIKTQLLGVVNIDYMDVVECVSITKAGSARIELALVLDVTGSMRQLDANGEQKIVGLQKAVVTMLDMMFGEDTQRDNIKIGVVPFNTHVNAGGSNNWDSSWADTNANSIYHGSRFIHVTQFGDFDIGSKVNHFRLYDSDSDLNWTGCVESRPYPLDELDIPPGASNSASALSAAMTPPSSAEEPDTTMRTAYNDQPTINADQTLSEIANPANLKFVPTFLGDDPDCDAVPATDGLCALPQLTNSWLSVTDIRIGGVNHTQGSHRFWYSRPDTAGFSEYSYRQRDYIDDEGFIGALSGARGGYYAHVVEKFRDLRVGGSFTVAERAVRDFYLDLGVRNSRFTDPAVDADPTRSTLNYDEFIFRASYVGWWDPAVGKYKHKYDLPKLDPTFSPANPTCPPPILAMTDDRLEVDGGDSNDDGLPDGGILDSLVTTGDTNIANGAMWGWRVVSDALPFTESTGPSDIGPNGTRERDWRRAVVIMTDGENTVYDRNTHRKSSISSYGYASEERMGDGIDTAAEMQAAMDNKMLRICRRMKQEDIMVFTVVFDIDEGSNIDTLMRSCAMRPASPYYFNAASAVDLEEAFEDIARNLTNLHVAQ